MYTSLAAIAKDISDIQRKIIIIKKYIFIYFVTELFLLKLWKSSFGALGVERPHGGAIVVTPLVHHSGRGSMVQAGSVRCLLQSGNGAKMACRNLISMAVGLRVNVVLNVAKCCVGRRAK